MTQHEGISFEYYSEDPGKNLTVNKNQDTLHIKWSLFRIDLLLLSLSPTFLKNLSHPTFMQVLLPK